MKENISNDEKKESFFKKIWSFIRSIFTSNKETKALDKGKLEINPVDKAKNDFWKNIKIEEELEDKELLELQRKYMNKEISVEDLTDDQIVKLTALYNRQTERIIRKTEQIEAETEIINAKIARMTGNISEE